MIISKQKPLDQILSALEAYQKLFLVGCNLCAALCQTGGEREVLAMIEELHSAGKEVVGFKVVESTCHLLETKKALKGVHKELQQSDALLSLACGAGTQTLASFIEKPIFTAVDTLFLGSIERWGRFSEVCIQCGDCVLNMTGGICPVTRCPKGLLNGPCGGMNKGKCETDPERECVWAEIYKTLKEQGRLDALKGIMPPRDYSKGHKPGRIVLQWECTEGK